MTEKIEIIAAILGVIGAFWAIVRYVFNPFFKKREEFNNIYTIVHDTYKRWEVLKYSVRGGAMISHDNFLIVNKYRSRFKRKKPEIKAFLFRNAIQNGLGGNWGYWLDMNKDNRLILLQLFLSLNKLGGLRPAWRSAYILEKIYAENISEIDRFISQNEKYDLNESYFIDIIKKNVVKKELHRLIQKGSKEEKEKLKYLPEEFLRNSSEINTFTKHQTIVS